MSPAENSKILIRELSSWILLVEKTNSNDLEKRGEEYLADKIKNKFWIWFEELRKLNFFEDWQGKSKEKINYPIFLYPFFSLFIQELERQMPLPLPPTLIKKTQEKIYF